MNQTLTAIIVAAVIGGTFAGGWYVNGNRWRVKYDALVESEQKQKSDFEQQQRAIEQQRQRQSDEIQKQAQQQIDEANRNADIARGKSVQLQHGVQTAISKLATGSSDTGTTGSSATGNSTGLLLTELFTAIDNAAGQYAAEADHARIAGLMCERAYDSLRSNDSAKN